MKILMALLISLVFMSLSACSATGPVVYPNSHFLSVGKQVAEQDIEACRQLAESAGARENTGQLGNVATNTAMGAGVGAASGAVGGATRERDGVH